MLGQIEEAFDERTASEQRLRRFVADASHELRTPLAAVRAYAELFDRGARERPDDLERAMTGIQRKTRRMGLLVDDLLLLARLDQGRPLERKPVELGAVAADAVDAAGMLDPGRTFEVVIPDRVEVIGDRERLRQILDNLLANVRAHTPPAAPAAVRVLARENDAVIEVADSGPALLRRATRPRLRALLPRRRLASARCRRSRSRPRHRSRDRAGARRHGGGRERWPRRRHRPDGARHDPPRPGARGSSPGCRRSYYRGRADVAQLVEHFTRNEGVRGSSPRVGFQDSGGSARANRLSRSGIRGRDLSCWGVQVRTSKWQPERSGDERGTRAAFDRCPGRHAGHEGARVRVRA